MADWEAKWANHTDINNGKKFNNGDGISAEDINAVVQAVLYAQDIDKKVAEYETRISTLEAKFNALLNGQ